MFSGDLSSTNRVLAEDCVPGGARLFSENLGKYVDNECGEGVVGDNFIALKYNKVGHRGGEYITAPVNASAGLCRRRGCFHGAQARDFKCQQQ